MTHTDTILVCSLEESSGKTAIALALARHAREFGEDVGYMKPKGTRLRSVVGKVIDEDPDLARSVLGLDAEMETLEPVIYSPTFVQSALAGQVDADEVRRSVVDSFESLAAAHDRMLLEGAGRVERGSIVGLADDDVAELLDARVLLVARFDSVYDVDAVVSVARRFGDRLDGVIFNAVPETHLATLDADGVGFLASIDVPVLGVIPRVEELSGVSVETLADEIGAEMLVTEGRNNLVERFSVGAMGADSALRHFRRVRNAAVVTGGDRAEIQRAAIEASGTACLILTGGHTPSGSILGAAARHDVPVLSVRADTLTAVERAEAVLNAGRTRDEKTIDRMTSLLVDHVDLDRIFDR